MLELYPRFAFVAFTATPEERAARSRLAPGIEPLASFLQFRVEGGVKRGPFGVSWKPDARSLVSSRDARVFGRMKKRFDLFALAFLKGL